MIIREKISLDLFVKDFLNKSFETEMFFNLGKEDTGFWCGIKFTEIFENNILAIGQVGMAYSLCTDINYATEYEELLKVVIEQLTEFINNLGWTINDIYVEV